MAHSREDIIEAILLDFPEMANYIVVGDRSALLDFPCPTSDRFGGLVVQLDQNTIWIRAYAPHSGNCLDTIDELIKTIYWFLDDDLGIAVGYKNGEWKQTDYFFIDDEMDLEEGLDYEKISWSGRFDK